MKQLSIEKHMEKASEVISLRLSVPLRDTSRLESEVLSELVKHFYTFLYAGSPIICSPWIWSGPQCAHKTNCFHSGSTDLHFSQMFTSPSVAGWVTTFSLHMQSKEKSGILMVMKTEQNEHFTALQPAACTAQPGWYGESTSNNSIFSAFLNLHYEFYSAHTDIFHYLTWTSYSGISYVICKLMKRANHRASPSISRILQALMSI